MTKYNCLILEPSYLIRKGLVSFFREFKHIGLIFDAENLEETEDFRNHQQIHILITNDDFISKFDDDDFLLKYIIKHNKQSKGQNILNILNPKDILINQISKDLESLNPKDDFIGEQLSEREIGVLKEVALGKTNKEIAEALFISAHTVITHRKNITQKLGIKTVSGLTMYAIIHNLIQPIALK
jgi:DNA-binding CsgD family transcriptional regulator